MSLRKVLSKLYPLLQKKEPYFFLFCIGSYPQRKESNHELPLILKKIRNNVKRIYIDAEYTNDNLVETINRLGNNCLIHPYNINHDEYNMIIEFCHIAGILNKSLSMVMEFTGILRMEYEKKENKTPYLYITPSDCMINTDDIICNPIFISNNNNIEFYSPNINNLGNEIESLFQGDLTDEKLRKLEFVKCIIDNFVKDIKEVYRILLNYVERKHCFNVDHDIVFIKDTPYFYPSLELLKKRMIGYNQYKSQNIINEFLNTECNNLEIFLKEQIQILLGIILLYNNNGDRHKVNDNFESIMFNNSKDVYEIIQRMNIVEI